MSSRSELQSLTEAVSKSLTKLKLAIDPKHEKQDDLLSKAIAELAQQGVAVVEVNGRVATMMDPSDKISDKEICAISDQVRTEFSGPSRELNRVFASRGSLYVDSLNASFPPGVWEFVDDTLVFAPSSLPLYRLKCNRDSTIAEVNLDPRVSLSGPQTRFGSQGLSKLLGLSGKGILLSDLYISDGEDQARLLLESEATQIVAKMQRFITDSLEVKRFADAVSHVNMTDAAYLVARAAKGACSIVTDEWAGHGWTIDKVEREDLPMKLLRPKTHEGKPKDQDPTVDAGENETATGTASPVNSGPSSGSESDYASDLDD